LGETCGLGEIRLKKRRKYIATKTRSFHKEKGKKRKRKNSHEGTKARSVHKENLRKNLVHLRALVSSWQEKIIEKIRHKGTKTQSFHK
jgi:hypothetical protein